MCDIIRVIVRAVDALWYGFAIYADNLSDGSQSTHTEHAIDNNTNNKL